MKNLRNFLLLIFVLLAFGPTAWAQFSGGTGTEADPYQISSIADWNTLATNVDNGTTYSGQFFQMTDDIGTTQNPVTTMVGKSESKSFQGTFDGTGHTLTFSLSPSIHDEGFAPFRYLKDATIKRLRTAGHIKAVHGMGGIAAFVYGKSTFIACHASIDLEAKYLDPTVYEWPDGDHGGLVAKLDKNGTFTFINCLYDGNFNVRYCYCSGGLVGALINNENTYSTVCFFNCLFAPESLNLYDWGFGGTIWYRA